MIVRAATGTRLELDAEETRLLMTLLSYDGTVPAAIRQAALTAKLEGKHETVVEAMHRDADDLDLFMPKLYNAISDAEPAPLF